MKSNFLTILAVLCFVNTSISQNYKFGKVSKEELLQKEHPTDPTADAAILYREIHTEFQYTNNDGFYMVTDVFERVKIYNKEGFDWASKEVDLYQSTSSSKDEIIGLKAYTYYLDGNNKIEEVKLKNDGVFEEKTTKYIHKTKFTMPDVREGCVIEYKYSIKSPFISNIDEFRLQETIPVEKIEIRFASPEYFVFKTHQKGWVPYKVESTSRDRTIALANSRSEYDRYGNMTNRGGARDFKFKEDIYTIDLTDVPAMKEESYAGNIDNYSTGLKFELSYVDFPGSSMKTYSTTWEDVSKGIYKVDSFGNELDKDNYFEDDLNSLLNGVSSQEEKVNKIFSFVLNKMTWNRYTGYYTNEGVKEAYKKGSGNVADINLMLIAMLRKANINANPVLVSTKDNGMPLFPTRNGFNYVIAAVELPQGMVLLDATNKEAEVGVLKPSIMNWQGRLILKDGTSSWVPLSPQTHAVKSSMVNVAIKPDMTVTGVAKNRFTGNYALKYRAKYKSLNADATRKALEKDANQAELSEVNFENLITLGEPVALDYEFETFGAVEDVAGKLYLSPMVFMATKESPFKPETRLYPIDFGYPMKDRYIFNIALPEGYKVESLPENAVYNLGTNMGSYRYLISQAGNNIQLSVEFSINKSYIAAEEYGNLKKFFELLIAKENEKVVLSKA
ncbi:transglutaminase domain-containing protein [Aequorivita marisscotiae]|uniref:Transglutaminase domain-containing protein n=1 Tax=Aequorivita marisscotiae TaxID=3040348 RepID=A0ABY8KXT3_9FLAO|nr:transglutaminase domain-containing protein [Aequorivita sp. Ant34-E75]WGF92870.1 transglutaminase domain-containing protein [Aequorivita sp. Ant34-E75]